MVDPSSGTWDAVERIATKAVTDAQDAIGKRSVPERDADFERGRLSMAKEILKLAEPPKAEPQFGPTKSY